MINFSFFLARFYDFLQWLLAGDFTPTIAREVNSSSPQSVLDLGCGTGTFSRGINCRYIGVDGNQANILYAQHKRSNNQHSFICKDFLEMPLNEKFDVVMMIQVLHHLSDADCRKIFGKVARVVNHHFIVSDVILPKYNPISRFLYYVDNGDYMRPLEAQRNLLKEHFQVQKEYTFSSPRHLYLHTMFVCSPK